MTKPLSSDVFASSGPIDLKILGDVSALYDLSRSMSKIYDTLDDVARKLGVLPDNLSYFWDGKSLESFRSMAKQHAEVIDLAATYAKDASSATDTYGGFIERGRGYFADFADSAKRAKLQVDDGRFIHPPEAPDLDCAVDGSDQDAKETYKYQVELFKEIRGLVDTWRSDLTKLVKELFDPLIDRIKKLSVVEELIKHLQEEGLPLFDALMEEADKKISNDLSDFLDKQQEHGNKWQEYNKDQRSGHPERGERGKTYDEDAHRKARDSIDAKLQKLGPQDFLLRGGKALGVAGGFASVGYDLSRGESPSKVAAGTVGGWVGAAGLGAALGAAGGTWAGPWGAAIGGFVAVWVEQSAVTRRARVFGRHGRP